MTELGGVCSLAPYESDKIESVGTPLPGMLFKVRFYCKKKVE